MSLMEQEEKLGFGVKDIHRLFFSRDEKFESVELKMAHRR
jgi:hypothetical protein